MVEHGLSLGNFLQLVNSTVLKEFNTVLIGGFSEPFYLARNPQGQSEIRFTLDYFSSALHELAHWCIAGRERLLLDDFGYWYVPTGRDGEAQEKFYEAEVKPQAVEMAFSRAIGLPFNLSHDNIGTKVGDGEQFAMKVDSQHRNYMAHGFPPRAQRILEVLRDGTNGH